MRVVSFFAALGLLSFLLLAACGGDNYVVGEGASCSTEGWVGGHGVCAEGLVCDELDNWTCRPGGGGSNGTVYYPGPPTMQDAACDGTPDDSGDAGSDAEKDAGISGLDGG